MTHTHRERLSVCSTVERVVHFSLDQSHSDAVVYELILCCVVITLRAVHIG